MEPEVTICIAAYKAAAFLEETVASARAQSYPNVKIVVAVDPAGDATERRAQRLADKSMRVVINPRRLGWIANTNRALAVAPTRYMMILPHDDILGPDYVALCMDALRSNEGAAVACTGIELFGDRENEVIVQRSIVGALQARLEDMIAYHFASIAYRGVIDTATAQRFTVPSSIGGYAADTLWLGQMACQGDIIGLDEVQYRKRMLPTSAHVTWSSESELERQEMWAVHCMELISTILATRPDLEWTDDLQSAWQYRVRHHLPDFSLPPHPSYDDPSTPLVEQVSHILESVIARPKPYSWVKA